MQVTPVNKKFGKYKPGDEFALPEPAANKLIRAGLLRAVTAEDAQISPRTGLPKRQYRRRDMQAEG